VAALGVTAPLLAGCGGSSAKPATSNAPAKPIAVAAVARPRVEILSPRPGAHTGSTVAVHVRVSGDVGAAQLRYALDGGRARTGGDHITLRDLTPGHHVLTVSLLTGAARTSRTFVVRAPAPAPEPHPASTTPNMARPEAAPPAPAPTPAPAPRTSTSNSPPPPHEAPPATVESPPPKSASTPAPPTGGIPQGNGGDMDGDNNGGPSDGDGNV
jgi:hypothetical protein